MEMDFAQEVIDTKGHLPIENEGRLKIFYKG